MKNILKPDICVIGAGVTGLSAAAAAAAFGVPVVLVEKAAMGGRHLNRGGVPAGALLAAAKHAHAMRHGARFGMADAEPEIDFRKTSRHVRGVIEAVAPNASAERFTALGVRVLRQEARFSDRRTVAAGEHEIRARHFIIATGSTPAISPIPGIGEIDYLTTDTIFGLTRRPGRLIVIGGGPHALELAQAYGRLGAKVAVVEARTVLEAEDPELVAILRARLRAEGIDIREKATAVRAERRGKTGLRIYIESENGNVEALDGTHLLIAVGDRPAVDGLDLPKADIAFSASGITVTDRLRTTNRRVHAIGDVTGGPQLAGAAARQAEILVRALLFRRRADQEGLPFPRATFTDPELASVGMSEAEARDAHRAIRVLRWPYAENDRAQAERRTQGLVKLVTDRRQRILGASIVGANAGELIGIWSLAIAKGLDVRDMAAHVPACPTMGEIGKRAAISYFADTDRGPLMRRIVRLLRVFG